MSVSFYCPDAPSSMVALYEDYPDELFQVYDAPFEEINLSNYNAQSFLDAMGVVVDDLVGKIEPDRYPEIRRLLLININNPSLLSENDSIFGNVYSSGRTEEYVVRTCKRLYNLVEAAQKSGFTIFFS